ncbi:anoctamin-7 [Lingula anatina]|uniref:Anoctamin n=1 Tax=Lingula anatina TaxID=7574 RepID=A0A1S3K8K7_LINAN|nr:anoctamin-7 [Lingula anatina]|eukprot:XP_013418581.1 anoctamin-7 [Lingula anatina]
MSAGLHTMNGGSNLPPITEGKPMDSILRAKTTVLKHKKKKRERSVTGISSENANKKRIDYVLVYTEEQLKPDADKEEIEEFEQRKAMRTKFQGALMAEGLTLNELHVVNKDDKHEVFVLVHTGFEDLCLEAESVHLEMPLKGLKVSEQRVDIEEEEKSYGRKLQDWVQELQRVYLQTDNEEDYISAPFQCSKSNHFKDFEDKDKFFRSSLRSLLTHNILINTDVRDKTEKESILKHANLKNHKKPDILAKKALPYLLHKKIYTDAFIIHDESVDDPENPSNKNKSKPCSSCCEEEFVNPVGFDMDPRWTLNHTWTRVFKYQPLWKIRNYFGEKIALYFAWSGLLITSLWMPTLFGLSIFFYGLHLSVQRLGNPFHVNTTSTENQTELELIKRLVDTAENLMDVIKEACDNEVTPFFALAICLWGTIFLEYWKRTNATLAYEWDVNNFEVAEPDRPGFKGTHSKMDPITDELTWYYPFYRQCTKYAASCMVLVLMVCLVFISVAGVILYRVVITVDYCTIWPSTMCLLFGTIASSLMNAISILILGKIYDKIAYILTDWENHRTQTAYDDALVIKLFAFQFANSYASLFYIAFFRGLDEGLFGLGDKYVDTCGTGNNCMSMLSFQVLVLMIIKPFPKLLKDVCIPYLKQLWREKIKGCCSRKENKVSPEKDVKVTIDDYVERERQKPKLEDFTLSEYTEKVIQYGYLMLFSASLPLGPLIALLTNLFDLTVDAKRLLWWYRRPVAFVAQDIGMWYSILQFVNVCGVVSNAFLIAFTAQWGKQFGAVEKLWLVIIFEHTVFALKFLLTYIIPDVPYKIEIQQNREKYQVAKKLESGQFLNKAQMKMDIIAQAATYVARTGSVDALQNNPDYLKAEEPTPQGSASSLKHRHKKKKHKLKLLGKLGVADQSASKASSRVTLNDADDGAALVPSSERKKRKKKGHHHKHGGHEDQGYTGDTDLTPRLEQGTLAPRVDVGAYPVEQVEYEYEPGRQHLHSKSDRRKIYKKLKPISNISYDKQGMTYLSMEQKFPNSRPGPPLENKTVLKQLPAIDEVKVATPAGIYQIPWESHA